MDESMLINGVLRSVLGGRRKRSNRALGFLGGGRGGSLWTNPSVLLTAAGVAWGLFETMQQQGAPTAAPGAAPSTPQGAAGLGQQPLPPLPNMTPSAGGTSDEARRIVRLTISAAYADGVISDEERAGILEQARGSGVEGVIEQELAQPWPLADIVAGVTDEGQRAALYVLAYGILRGDEQPNGAERIYLAKLAHLLGLDPKRVQELEASAARSIDAAPEAEP